MKTERAIELLNRISDSQFDGPHGDERREALEMAVRALEGDGDTIYRQDAIDAFVKYVADGYAESPNDFEGYMGIVKKLPSAQPEILACGSGELVKESDGLVNDLVKDCISRQAAIDIVRNRVKRFTTACVLAVTEIEQLPFAKPECKKGKWITVLGRLGNEVECNQCHSVFWYWMGNYRFCPSCGARMDGESDEML